MNPHLLFHFKNDISSVHIPEAPNNPFSNSIPAIARIAAKEFQQFIEEESKNWEYNFKTLKGKMFGILVVQKEDNSYAYLGAVSGKLNGLPKRNKFVPSVFDEATDDFFIDKGMKEVSNFGKQIESANSLKEISILKEKRKQHSLALQRQLFENYHFLNLLGVSKNVLEIFAEGNFGYPPAAAGECTAPKLLNYALKNQLKPIAIAEFWWGNSIKNNDREHLVFYPACKDKCRPILEFMLGDSSLWSGIIK